MINMLNDDQTHALVLFYNYTNLVQFLTVNAYIGSGILRSLTALTASGLSIECYASICPSGSKPFRLPNFGNPFDTPNSLVGFGMSGNASFGVN